MTMQTPPANDPASDPASPGSEHALFTIDLSGASGEPESTPAFLGRIVGGALLMILAGVAALAALALYFGDTFIPGFTDWADLLGDFLLFLAAVAGGLALVGFEILRRGRRKRGAAATAGVGMTPPPEPEAPPASSLPPKIVN